MPKSAWPTGSQLSAAVAGVGGAVPAGYTAADLIAAAIAEWERKTGWTPFLANVGTTTLEHDPSGWYTLRLRAPFFTVTSVTVDGVTKASGTDFWPMPYNSQTVMTPIVGLRFREPLVGDPMTISVTGRLGYDDDIHEDAWMAVLNRAVAMVLEIDAGTTGQATEIEQGLVKVKYDSTSGRGTIDRLNKNFTETVMRYKRADVF